VATGFRQTNSRFAVSSLHREYCAHGPSTRLSATTRSILLARSSSDRSTEAEYRRPCQPRSGLSPYCCAQAAAMNGVCLAVAPPRGVFLRRADSGGSRQSPRSHRTNRAPARVREAASRAPRPRRQLDRVRSGDPHRAGTVGHPDVSTTMICTQVLYRGPADVQSLADSMGPVRRGRCLVPRNPAWCSRIHRSAYPDARESPQGATGAI
jgi:hypothetical protein